MEASSDVSPETEEVTSLTGEGSSTPPAAGPSSPARAVPQTGSSSSGTPEGATNSPPTVSGSPRVAAHSPRVLSASASAASPSLPSANYLSAHSPQLERHNWGENTQWRSYWLSFIKNAGIDKEFAVHYASNFLENELDGSMLGDIDHSLLISVGVKKAGHRIKIIRYAHAKLASKKNILNPAVNAGKGDKANSREKLEENKERASATDRKKRNHLAPTTTVSSVSSGSGSVRRPRANSKEQLKRTEVSKGPGSAPVPRREAERETSEATLIDPVTAEKAFTVVKKEHSEQRLSDYQLSSQLQQQSEEEDDETESESTVSDSTTDSDSDDFDFDDEDEVKSMQSQLKKDSSKEKISAALTKKPSNKEAYSPAVGRAFQGRPEDDLLSGEYDDIADLSQYHEIKFFFNLEPTKRYLETTAELTGRDFTEAVCKNLKCESGSLVVFTVQDNGEFVPLKEDDFINRSEIHYVIESRKVSKDIKKLKERLKKEKPVWDSDNWPLIVDFVDSKDIYMAEHGQIGLCMCPGRKKKKKRHVWARDLYKDLDRLQQVYNCDVLVTLVREQELRDLKIEDIFDEVKKRGMDSLYLPIKDKWIPKSTPRLIDLVEKIITCLRQGKTVVVHCNGGKGRSATVIVACLIALGQSISHAIKILQRVRKGTIRNPLQQAYLRKFLSEWTAAQKTKQRKKNIIAITLSQQLEGGEKTSDTELVEYPEGEEGSVMAAAKDAAVADEPSAFKNAEDISAEPHITNDFDQMTVPAPSSQTGSTLAVAAATMADHGEASTQTPSDHLPGPPSSEGEAELPGDVTRADRVHWDGSQELGEKVAGTDHKRSASISGTSGDEVNSSGSIPVIPHLTPLEKKLMKIRKLVKKTERRIEKKESMIAKERQHLEDLKVELKRVSAELKKEMSENKDGNKSGSFIEQRGRRSDNKLVKSSSSRSPGPVRKKGDTDDTVRDKEDKKKERKEQKEKEKEERRKEREERDRERKEKEREKREKGREERERREKEKEERKEKKKEEKMKKKETGKLSKHSSNTDLTTMLTPTGDPDVILDELQSQLRPNKGKEESRDASDVDGAPAPSPGSFTSVLSPPSSSATPGAEDNGTV